MKTIHRIKLLDRVQANKNGYQPLTVLQIQEAWAMTGMPGRPLESKEDLATGDIIFLVEED